MTRSVPLDAATASATVAALRIESEVSRRKWRTTSALAIAGLGMNDRAAEP
jgi:hypothetical protein